MAPGQHMDPAEIKPSHPAPGPVLGGDGKTGTDEREEVGHSCVDSCGSSISFRQLSAATQQPGCTSTCPVKNPQPTCSVHLEQDGGHDADGFVHVRNGLPDGGQLSEKFTSSPALGPHPVLETGFADLILFCFNSFF